MPKSSETASAPVRRSRRIKSKEDTDEIVEVDAPLNKQRRARSKTAASRAASKKRSDSKRATARSKSKKKIVVPEPTTPKDEFERFKLERKKKKSLKDVTVESTIDTVVAPPVVKATPKTPSSTFFQMYLMLFFGVFVLVIAAVAATMSGLVWTDLNMRDVERMFQEFASEFQNYTRTMFE